MLTFSRRSMTLFAAYFFGLHIVLVVVALKTDLLSRIGTRLGISSNDEYHINARAYLSGFALQQKIDAMMRKSPVVFLGDSIVQQLPRSANMPSSLNLGLGGIDTITLSDTVRRYPYLDRASRVVISIGVNDLCIDNATVADMKVRLEKLSANLPGEARVVWSAILPVDPLNLHSKCPTIESEAIKRVNELIRGICAKRKSCTYSDGFSRLADDRGNLAAKFNSGDGLHLSPRGYMAWSEQLRRDIENSGAAQR